jgi:hypothetical protein
MSWALSQSRRSSSTGFQAAIEARIGTGPPLARRASRSSTSRSISMLLPAPGSPSTISRPVGTRASTSASSSPSPARLSGPAAWVPVDGERSRPALLLASFTSESQASLRDGSAADQDTGNGYGSYRRRIAASSAHCSPTAVASWSATCDRLKLLIWAPERFGPRNPAHASHAPNKPKLTGMITPVTSTWR